MGFRRVGPPKGGAPQGWGGRSNVHVWSSRAVVCEPRRPGLVGPPGFHTTARDLRLLEMEPKPESLVDKDI